MNEEKIFIAKVVYDREIKSKTLEQRMDKLFIKARNLACDLINSELEAWNAEYDKEVNGEFDHDYIAYIAEKEQKILDMINRIGRESNNKFKLVADKETADILGQFKVFGNDVVTCHVILIPLEN